MSLLECQKRFESVWNRCQLGRISKAIFGLPPDDGSCGVPNAFFSSMLAEQELHSLGSIWTVRINGEMRVKLGDPSRDKIEPLLIAMNKRARVLSGLVQFIQATPATPVRADIKRLAGQGVEVIPLAWDLQMDVSRV